MTKYKVGDRVRCIKDGVYYGLNIGAEGTVTEKVWATPEGACVSVRWDGDPVDSSKKDWAMLTWEIEKIENPHEYLIFRLRECANKIYVTGYVADMLREAADALEGKK